MKLINVLNKMANDELPDGTLIRAKKGLYWAEIKVRKEDNDSERKIKNEYILKMMDIVGLNGEVEVIVEDKEIEIPKHIPNEVIQDLDRAICPANVKCIAHKVNELINYLQYTNKGDSNKWKIN